MTKRENKNQAYFSVYCLTQDFTIGEKVLILYRNKIFMGNIFIAIQATFSSNKKSKPFIDLLKKTRIENLKSPGF